MGGSQPWVGAGRPAVHLPTYGSVTTPVPRSIEGGVVVAPGGTARPPVRTPGWSTFGCRAVVGIRLPSTDQGTPREPSRLNSSASHGSLPPGRWEGLKSHVRWPWPQWLRSLLRCPGREVSRKPLGHAKPLSRTVYVVSVASAVMADGWTSHLGEGGRPRPFVDVSIWRRR